MAGSSQVSKVITLNDKDFEERISSSPSAVVDFWNGGCMSCRSMLLLFEQLSEMYPDVLFCKVNTEMARMVSQKYDVLSVPTILFFKGGKKVARMSGLKPLSILEEAVNRYFLSKGTEGPSPYDESD